MTPYVRRFIPDEEVEVFEKIRYAVQNMPDVELGQDENGQTIILSCHILARAVARTFSLQYVDGYFYPRHEHSWLITPKGNIIDAYPVAVLGGPVLMDGNNGIIAHVLYLPGNTRKISRGRFGRRSFRNAVNKLCTTFQP